MDEVVRRAVEAAELGATEVCVQAGLLPDVDARVYPDILRRIREAAPALHLHAYSPEEVLHGARHAGMAVGPWLAELRAAGLDTLPGTSAEILDDEVRRRISPGRITTREWIEVVTTAHGLGIRTTATMMFGHVETPGHRARHLALLRDLQAETGGFTEFVPLSFVHAEAPLFRRSVGDVPPGPGESAVRALYAVARLLLGPSFRNIQASWVKEGLDRCAVLLDGGVNDLGGTLINESISTAAGARFGQRVRPRTLRELAWSRGRPAIERTTSYGLRRRYSMDEAVEDPLDAVDEADPRFGSYRALAEGGEFPYRAS